MMLTATAVLAATALSLVLFAAWVIELGEELER